MRRIIHSLWLKRELVLVVLLISISAVAHGLNMFQFPYYENDEAIYLGRAWSLTEFGRVAPYTYWYDHAPAGWMLIAAWTTLTGGFFTFDFSVNTGRVFMLIIHLLNTLLLYRITRQLTRSPLAGALSVLVFSLSPLAIYFQRRVLLDNLMTFWILLCIQQLLVYTHRLRTLLISGLCFGIAFLTKETAVFLLPGILYLLLSKVHWKHSLFGVASWFGTAGTVIATYILYATLKGELLPAGILSNSEHVSLLGTLSFQAGREGGSIFTPQDSNFWYNMRTWLGDDPVLLILGLAALLINATLGIRHRNARTAALLAAGMLWYLMRGGIVIEFYILPLIPLLALNIAVLAHHFGRLLQTRLPNVRYARTLPASIFLATVPAALLALSWNVRDGRSIYTSNQTGVQQQAIEWILAQQSPQAFYAMDNYGYVDLMVKNAGNFANAHHYWKAEHDPEISRDILRSSPENVDFLLVSPQLVQDVQGGSFPLIGEALANAHPIKNFSEDGWGVAIWATKYPRRILRSTWQSFRDEFIQDGQVLDPAIQTSTSEGQSYALLRAVQLDDRETFDAVLAWTNEHLRLPNQLFAWKYGSDPNDRGAASDADQDIALALLFAGRRWEEPGYTQQARKLLHAIWEEEVVFAGETPYLSAGNWGDAGSVIVLNPSYLSPAHYRIFAQADPTHDWERLIESSYRALEQCSFALGESGVLPPEWCAIRKATERAEQPNATLPRATEYGYNAFRTPWRVALDHEWFGAPEAAEYLSQLSFLGNTWRTQGKLATAYTHQGQVWEDYESVAAYSGNLGYFLVAEPSIVDAYYRTTILEKLFENGSISYWEDPENYYTQNWAWFATALYSGEYTNLWEDSPQPPLPAWEFKE